MTKSEQRETALAARRAMSAAERASCNEELRKRLEALLYDWRGRTVFSYLPTADEADPGRMPGFVTAYPVTESGGRMEAYIPAADDPLAPGPYGIRQPDPTRGRLVLPEQIDVVIVPCVAFDKKCRRLGHGGGYYDRYFLRCPQALLVAAAFEAQRLGAVETDENDVPIHIIVTEKKVYLP